MSDVANISQMYPSAFTPVPIPEGSKLYRNGEYFVLHDMNGYEIAGRRGRVPYHRFILYERLNKPTFTPCHWCGYVLPWKTSLMNPVVYVVNADHLDGHKWNNSPENLVPSCNWCNANRNWAEDYPIFWTIFRNWLKDVPPWVRPNLLDLSDAISKAGSIDLV